MTKIVNPYRSLDRDLEGYEGFTKAQDRKAISWIVFAFVLELLAIAGAILVWRSL